MSSEEDSEIDDIVEGEGDEEESDDEEYYRQIKKIKEDKKEKINAQKKAKIEEIFQDDPTYHVGEDDVRGINRKILKNKGLTRKRKKIDRNSRVKLRKKFEKAEYKLKVISYEKVNCFRPRVFTTELRRDIMMESSPVSRRD